MKKHFVTGLAILLPLAVTFLIINFLVTLLTRPFVGIMSDFLASYNLLDQPILFLSANQVLLYSSKALSLVTLFVIILLLGLTTRFFFVRIFLKIGDFILHRIPFVNKIYKAIQDVVHILFAKQQEDFGQVVLAPFPNKDTLCIGFVTKESMEHNLQEEDNDFVSVFVPGTPNPTIGYMLMYKKSQLHFLDMTADEALKTIVSCGVMITEFKPRLS